MNVDGVEKEHETLFVELCSFFVLCVSNINAYNKVEDLCL